MASCARPRRTARAVDAPAPIVAPQREILRPAAGQACDVIARSAGGHPSSSTGLLKPEPRQRQRTRFQHTADDRADEVPCAETRVETDDACERGVPVAESPIESSRAPTCDRVQAARHPAVERREQRTTAARRTACSRSRTAPAWRGEIWRRAVRAASRAIDGIVAQAGIATPASCGVRYTGQRRL